MFKSILLSLLSFVNVLADVPAGGSGALYTYLSVSTGSTGLKVCDAESLRTSLRGCINSGQEQSAIDDLEDHEEFLSYHSLTLSQTERSVTNGIGYGTIFDLVDHTTRINHATFRLCPAGSFQVEFDDIEDIQMKSSAMYTDVYALNFFNVTEFRINSYYTAVMAKCQKNPQSIYVRVNDYEKNICVESGDALSDDCNIYVPFQDTTVSSEYCTKTSDARSQTFCRFPYNEEPQTTHSFCTPGYWCDGYQRFECVAGTVCTGNSTEAAACPAGKSCFDPAAPIDCPAGYVCNENTTLPVLCGFGYYCVGGVAIACAANEYCPPGSASVNITCNSIGTQSVEFVDEFGVCNCYTYFEGDECSIFTLMGWDDEFTNFYTEQLSPVENTSCTTQYRNGIIQDVGANPNNCSLRNTEPLPLNEGFCQNSAFPFYLASSRSGHHEALCCYEVESLWTIDGGESAARERKNFLCRARNVQRQDPQPWPFTQRPPENADVEFSINIGYAYYDPEYDWHYLYCCDYGTRDSKSALVEYVELMFNFEDLLRTYFIDTENESVQSAVNKYFYAALILMSIERYMFAYMAFSYVFMILNNQVDSKNEKTFIDYDSITQRSIDIIQGRIYEEAAMIDSTLTTEYLEQLGENFDFKPEFVTLYVRFYYLLTLRQFMTDTLAQFLVPLSNDLVSFVQKTTDGGALHQCKFNSDGSIDLPPCAESNNFSIVAEQIANIARCSIAPASFNNTQYGSAVMPPLTYIGHAFVCLRTVEKTETNKPIYTNAVAFLSEITETVNSIYKLDSNADVLVLRRLLSTEYELINAIGRDKRASRSVNDNTVNFYQLKLADFKDRITNSQIRFQLSTLQQTISASIDAQTALLSSQIAQSNYDMFLFLDGSFTATYNSIYNQVSFDADSVNAQIAKVNTTLHSILYRIESDVALLNSSLLEFDARLEAINSTMAERIEYLFDVETAIADLRYARARLAFIRSLILQILAFALAFTGPIGVAASTIITVGDTIAG